MERRNDLHHRRRGLVRFLIELNLFETDLNDRQEINIQRWSTRIYIVLLYSAMSILLAYNASTVKTQQIEVKNPSLKTYFKLHNIYDTNLKCPCTQLSASYRTFAELIPVFHDICSSAFVSQKWIDLLFDDRLFLHPVLDFRVTASNQFQVLRELCKFSQTTINNDIEGFYNDELISAYLLSEPLLKAELISIAGVLQTNSIAKFLRFLSFVRTYVLGNQLMTAIETDSTEVLTTDDGLNWSATVGSIVYRPPGTNINCYCTSLATCNMSSALYNSSAPKLGLALSWIPSQIYLQVDNWFTACWPLESLLLSSVDNSFLNNQTALNLIATYSNWPSDSTPTTLNISKETNQSTTFTDILETLFMESFSTELNYSLYYAQCRPRSCLYSIEQHSSVLYMFTALLGLYGGLSVVLRLVIPYVVGFLIRYLNRTPHERPSIDTMSTTITWKQRARTMVKLVRDLLVNLNLFKSSLRQQPSDIKQQLWMTRSYITLLTIALIILALYGILSFETKLIRLSNPSFSTVRQLQSQTNLISTLQCSCTQLSIPHGQFVELQPFYHQVCSSDLVSDDWIQSFDHLISSLIAMDRDHIVDVMDFTQSQALFVLLQALCEFSNETIAYALQTFKRTQLVGVQLLTVDDFSNQMFSAIREFQQETINSFIHFLQLLRNTTHVNQLLTSLQNNFAAVVTGPPDYIVSFYIATYAISNNISSGLCTCANDVNCKGQWGLFDGDPAAINLVHSLPGLYFACHLVESLLQSTLECFYDNQDCMTIIINFYNVSTFGNINRLNSSINNSRFARTSPIESLVSEMFIEYWTQSINYSSYFDQCQPASCSYTISQRNTLLETITRIVGLIGGLTVSLRILVPFLIMACVGIIRRLWPPHQETATELTPPRLRLVTVGNKILDWLKKVNVFEDRNRAVSIQEQCLATRIYIFLLVIALFILVLYTSMTYYLNTFTITNPSLEHYQQLQQWYGLDAVTCPCSRSTIIQSTFIQLECNFHPVCTSHFISDSYLQTLFELYDALDITYASSNAFTLQGTMFAHLHALSSLCNLAKNFVTDAQQQYLGSSVVSTYISDYDLFEKKTNVSLASFRSTLPNTFSSSFQMIRGLMQGNGFVSVYSTNWYPVTYIIANSAKIYFKPQYYGNDSCSCATSATCTQPSTPLINGYLVGCTPLEALLQSTIECLYEQSCVRLLGIYLNMSLPDSLIALNKNTTRFSSTNTIQSIVEEMFIETCSSNISYNQFFEQCKPAYCSVTLFESGNLVVVITTILGLYGGLTTFLQLIVPFIIFSTCKLIRKYKQRAQVGVQQIPPNSLNNNTMLIDNTGHEEQSCNNPNPNSNLNPIAVDTDAALESAPITATPLTSFLQSIASHLKVLIGFTLFILVVAAIVLPSVYFTWQKQHQTALAVSSTITSTPASINTNTTISKITTTNTSTAASFIMNTTMSTTIATTFSAITVPTSPVMRCTNLTFATPVSYAAGYYPQMIAVDDLNGDGRLDLAVVNTKENTVSVLLGIGNGSFGSQTRFLVGLSPVSAAVGDFNRDGRVDLAIISSSGNTMSVLYGTGSGNFRPQIIYSTGLNPSWIAAKDINGDGRLDLLIVNSYSSNVGVFLGLSNGDFTSQTTYFTIANPTCVAVNDFDGDGHLDLVVFSGSWPIMNVLLGTGNGSFQSPTMFLNSPKSQSIVSSDFNGDGRPDVVVISFVHSTASINVLLGIGDGSFGLPTIFPASSTSQSRWFAVGDFNGDTLLDLVVTFVSSSNVSVFLGAGNGSFGVPMVFSAGPASMSYGIAVGDFNNDGRLDIVISDTSTKNSANILLNTCT